LNEGFVTISDTGDGYPLVYAKRIGATNKRDSKDYIGNFGEGVKLSLLSCVREGIGIRLLSRDWMIEPKIKAIEGQDVLIYDIYITDAPITGTTVIMEAVPEITAIVNNLGLYFLHFRSDQDCLYGDIGSGIYPLADKTARLYNKGVFVKEITALYSYGVSLEGLNRDRDVISHQDVAQAVRRIWENVDNPCLIRPLIIAATKDFREREGLLELYYSISPKDP
jgi:hypothetical protein